MTGQSQTSTATTVGAVTSANTGEGMSGEGMSGEGTSGSGSSGSGSSSSASSSGDSSSADTGGAGGFLCGDASCGPGPEACLLCEPPAATTCVDATRDPDGVVNDVCGGPQEPGAVIVACESSEDCAEGSYCMWTLSFGYTIVECAPLACAAQCSCTPQLRQLCSTLSDCPDCAIACDDSLELGLPLKTCK